MVSRIAALPERGADLAELVWVARETDLLEPLQRVERSVTDAAQKGWIDVGRIVFRPLHLLPRAAVEHILEGWRAVGRNPEPGEIVWFVSLERLQRITDATSR